MLASALLSALVSSALVGAQNIDFSALPLPFNISQGLPINTTEICGNFNAYCSNSSIPNPLANICGPNAPGVSPPVTTSCVLPNGTDISKYILGYMNISVPSPNTIQIPYENNITVPTAIPNGVPLPKADGSLTKRATAPSNNTIVGPHGHHGHHGNHTQHNTTACSASITTILDLAPNYGKMITISVPANGTAVTQWKIKTVAPANTNVTSTIGVTHTTIHPFNRKNIEFITIRGNGTDGAIPAGSVKVVQVFFSTNGNATNIFNTPRVTCDTD